MVSGASGLCLGQKRAFGRGSDHTALRFLREEGELTAEAPATNMGGILSRRTEALVLWGLR